MCLLAIFFRAASDAELIVGANRDEYYARLGEPPQFLSGPLMAVGGRDPLAGGTWLGVNARGVVAAVTNRFRGPIPQNPRSRGLLVRDLLACPTAKRAVELATNELNTGHYAGCNVFCGDSERAVIIEGAEWMRIRPLPPGLHVIANGDINDGSDMRVLHALDWLGQQDYSTANFCVKSLKVLCAMPAGEYPPMCLHGDDRGTVSSSIIALRKPLSRSVYLHSQGPPDTTPYEDCSKLLHEIALGGGR
jgi:uncharacterized protein with NRDE domain